MKLYKPTTPARRGMSKIETKEVTRKKPEKSLVKAKPKKAGRGGGKITTRHKGGGHKKKYRLLDFKRDKIDIPAKVSSIEYDPNRSSFIALVIYADGEKRYILAPNGLKVGDEIICSKISPLKAGNRLLLKNIPVGTAVYNIELIPGKGGQLVRSAGNYATVVAQEGGFTHLVFPSGEIRMIKDQAMASVGELSNPEQKIQKIGKAGRTRHLGIRPTVRGSAMSPRDHPHGGGEGRSPIGMKHPKTLWGKPAYGVKTRKKNKASDKFIIKRRKKKRK